MSGQHGVAAAVLILGLALAACGKDEQAKQPVGGLGPDSLHSQVLAELKSYYNDFSDRNWGAFRDHFWPGATITTYWQPVGLPSRTVVTVGIAEFVAKAPEGPGSKPIFEERLQSAEVQAEGNLAQAWAKYSAKFGDSTTVVEWQGIDAITLMRHEGRWRIVSIAYVDTQ